MARPADGQLESVEGGGTVAAKHHPAASAENQKKESTANALSVGGSQCPATAQAELEPQTQPEHEAEPGESGGPTRLDELSAGQLTRIAEGRAVAAERVRHTLQLAQQDPELWRADWWRRWACKRSEENGLGPARREWRLAQADRMEDEWIRRLHLARPSPIACSETQDQFLTQRRMRVRGVHNDSNYVLRMCTDTGALFLLRSEVRHWLLNDKGQHVFGVLPRLSPAAEGPGY